MRGKGPVALAVVAALIIVIALFVWPVGAGSGTPRYCYVMVNYSGTVQTVVNFYVYGVTLSPTEGTCTILPVPGVGANIFAFSVQATISMSGGGGAQSFSFNCPALSTSCGFSGQVQLQAPPGQYTITFTAPGYPICQSPSLVSSCPSSYSVPFTVT